DVRVAHGALHGRDHAPRGGDAVHGLHGAAQFRDLLQRQVARHLRDEVRLSGHSHDRLHGGPGVSALAAAHGAAQGESHRDGARRRGAGSDPTLGAATVDLEPVALRDVVALRRAKVGELRVRSFSWGHERHAGAARAFRIREGHAETGYALATDEALIEFAVSPAWRGRAQDTLTATIKSLGLREIRVRTDDGLASEVALAYASRER